MYCTVPCFFYRYIPLKFLFCSLLQQVFVDPLTPDDLLFIASKKFPLLSNAGDLSSSCGATGIDGDNDGSLLSRMIAFNR